MGQAIGDVLPLALGIAISPVPIIAVILMLFSRRAGTNSTSFLAGWVLGVLVGTVVLVVVANSADLTQDSGEPTTGVSWLKVVLGLLLVLLAVRNFRARPRAGETPELPKWLQAIDELTPGKAFGLAVILSVVNPKNLLMIVGAASLIGQADLSGDDTAIVIAVFVVIAISTVLAPVALYRVMGARAQPMLDDMRAWLTENNATVMAVLMLVIGAVLIGKGIGPLID